MVFLLGTNSFHKILVIFAYSPLFCKFLFSFHIISIMGIIWFAIFFLFNKTQLTIFNVFNKQLNVNWLGHRFRSKLFVQIFRVIFSFLPVFVVLFAVVWHILYSERFQSLSVEVKRIFKWFDLMYNVSSQFETYSFQKSNVLLNFALLLISCRLVTMSHWG